MVQLSPLGPVWRLFILVLACLMTSGQCSWLKSTRQRREMDTGYISTLTSGYRHCPPKQVKCWCGSEEDQRMTIVEVKQCPFSTAWGSLCEPCQTPQDTCATLQHCARCMPVNPHAICAQCPPDRHGLHCELERPCKTPNVSEHMVIHPHYTKKGVYKLEFRCTEGRVRHGPRNIRCNPHHATWNRDPPSCVLPKRCSDLPNTTIPFTRIKHKTSDHVVLECDEGYVTSGTILQTTLQCEHGAWVQIGESVRCERRGCPVLSAETGNVYYSEEFNSTQAGFVSPGSRAKVTCQEGFVLQGSPEVNCSTDGQWKPSVPVCVARKCESEGARGKKCSLNTTSSQAVFLSPDTEIFPGQVVTMGCKEGAFRKRGVGDTTRYCFFNGTLSGSDIECKEESVCYISPTNDSHLRFCRRSGGPCTPGQDTYRDRTLELPDNVVPLGGRVMYGCDSPHYQLDSSHREAQCTGKALNPPRCMPVCGKRHPPKNQRIAGGSDSPIAQWPWQAGLMLTDGRDVTFVCGATLIYDRWALTAGHCVAREASDNKSEVTAINSRELRLVYGMTLREDMMRSALQDDEFKGQFGVQRVIVHHAYNKDTLDHDIALLQLQTAVTFSHHVGLACLPATLHCSQRRLVTGKEGVVTGWGATESDQLSDRLRELRLSVANTTQCEKHYQDQGYNTAAWTENMFCAESNSTAEDTTDGDSGGPFVVEADSAQWVVEGIVSWGVHKNDVDDINTDISGRRHLKLTGDPFSRQQQHCAGGVCYSGYTRVARFLDWIQETTGRNNPDRCA